VILLDTHAWVWWVAEPARLSKRAAAAVRSADALGISAISCWEVAMLVAHKRLRLDRDVLVWVQQALSLPRIVLLPITPEIAVASTRLPGRHHGDPADRILTATARETGVALVTRDRGLRAYREMRTIW